MRSHTLDKNQKPLLMFYHANDVRFSSLKSHFSIAMNGVECMIHTVTVQLPAMIKTFTSFQRQLLFITLSYYNRDLLMILTLKKEHTKYDIRFYKNNNECITQNFHSKFERKKI